MNDLASADANIQTAILEIISEGISGGLLVYDRNDLVVFASHHVQVLLTVASETLVPGTRMRDLLAAAYDGGARFSSDSAGSRRILSREDWIADHISALWKERSDTVERRGADRWISFVRRRLPTGYGVSVIKDVSESRKREEQWRLDAERVQLTEDVLDSLPFPVMVKDSNLTYVAVNDAACRFHALPPEALLGNVGADVHSPHLEERLDSINRRILETGERIRLAERLTRPDGSQIVIVANKFRIGNPGRHYLVTAMQDITDLVDIDEKGRGVIPLIEDQKLYSAVLRRQDYTDGQRPGSGVRGLDVLLVSADADFCDVMGANLRSQGATVSIVTSPEELSLCLELATENAVRVDLVVADQRLHQRCVLAAAAHQVPLIGLDASVSAASVCETVSQRLGGTQDEDWHIVSDDDLRSIDILVAEDNEVNKIVFSQILEGLGYRYAIATDGEEAVRLWQQQKPAMVLMDITLPKLTGFEASRKIRSLEDDGNPVPIIGVLPQAFERDREECLASGMNDVILKPISPEALESLFERFMLPAPLRRISG